MFKKYGVVDSVAPCRRDVDFVASVVLVRDTNVVAACGVWSPCLTDSGVKVSFHLATKGRKWMGVVVVRAPQVGMCRNGGADAGWAEEIECLRLSVCSACGRSWHHRWSGKSLSAPQRIATKWLGFEGLNSLFGDVTSVIVWGYELVSHVILLDGCFEILRTLIVKNVVLLAYPACIQSVEERLISSDQFA